MTPRRAPRPFFVLLTATTAFTLAACGGGASSDSVTPAPQVTASQDAAQQAPVPGDRAPGGGVSGRIVQVGDGLMQVRDDDGQTAVTWTDETTVQVTTTVDLSAVSVGSCLTAMTGGGLPSGDDEIATQSADENPVARTVTLSEPVDGVCSPGLGGGAMPGQWPGELPPGMPTDLPSGMPTDLPTDMPTDMPRPGGAAPEGWPTGGPGAGGSVPGGAFGGLVAGVVTAVDGSTITVEATAQDGTTSSATVTVDSTTTFSATVAGDASALVVGQCASVRGTADDAGKVTATSVLVSSPGEDGCTAGFGGRGPGGLRAGEDGRVGGQGGDD